MDSSAPKIIFLTGFMGAGKSTVGKMLAEKLNYNFADTDTLIVEQKGQSIAEIFAGSGEDYFRELETDVLKNLELSSPTVFATGGGIVLRKENRSFMRQQGAVVYLRASWPETRSRLLDSKERPLVNQQEGWESVEKRWLERQKFYEDADYIIDTDKFTPEECVTEIYKHVIDK